MTTARDNDLPVTADLPQDLLPEFWPQAGPASGKADGSVTVSPAHLVSLPAAPVRRVWIPWPLAVVLAPLFWLMPRRMGPHFAATGWLGAIIAHVFWVYYAIGWMLLVAMTRGQSLLGKACGVSGSGMAARWPAPTFGEVLRAPLAVMPSMIGTSGAVLTGLAIAAGVTVFIELIVLGVAILLVPYATAGERLKWAFGRSVRLALWSSTGLVVVAFGLDLLASLVRLSDPCAMLVVGLSILWIVWLPIRAGLRYAGPPEGTEWEPLAPQCDACGYGLTGLPYHADCPECGRPVRDSLPDKRGPSRFGAAKGWLGRAAAYLPTCMAALASRRFFSNLRIRGEHPTAVRFAGWTCVLTSLVLSVPIVIMIEWVDSSNQHYFDPTRLRYWSEACLTCGILGGSLVGFLGLVALVCSRFGYEPLQRCSTVVFYWSAWLPPVGLTTVGVVLLCGWLLHKEFFRYPIHPPHMGTINLYDMLALLPSAIPLVLGVHALFRLGRALRQTQYANA